MATPTQSRAVPGHPLTDHRLADQPAPGPAARAATGAPAGASARASALAAARPQGRSAPLGATLVGGGVNFSLFSRTATGVELLFFDRADDARPARVLP